MGSSEATPMDELERDDFPLAATVIDPTSSDAASEKDVLPLPTVAMQPPDMPDGGLEAWLVVLGGFCASFATYGMATAFGVFTVILRDDILRDSTRSEIAWCGSLQIWGITAIAAISGKLFDLGYCRRVVWSGSALLVFAIFMTSLCHELWQFIIAQGFLAGIAMGTVFVPSVSATSHYFKKRRSLAMGLVASGSSVGGVILPIQIREMLKVTTFGWTVRTSAFLCLALLSVTCIFTRSRLPPKRGGPVLDFRIFRGDPAYCLLVIGCFFSQIGLWLPVYFGSAYALEKGMSTDLAFYTLSIMSAGSFFGRIIPNAAADYIGAVNVFGLSCASSGVLILIWMACTTTPSILAFSVIFGFAQGAFVSAVPAAIASLTDDMRTIGSRTGMLFFATSWTSLASGPVAGALVQRSYTLAASFCGVMVFIAGCFVFAARTVKARERGTWRV